MTRESYRVALYVLVDFPGGDAYDAATGASIALRQAFRENGLVLHMRDGDITGRVITAMDITIAVANGKLLLVLPHAVRSGGRSEEDDQMLRSPASREPLEEAARWLVEHADPADPGVRQTGDLTVENMIGGGDSPLFAMYSAIERGADEAITREHYRVIAHAALLRRQEF